MTSTAIMWLAVLGFMLTCLAGIGSRVLREIPWHELEEYCRRRKRRDLFDSIHDNHDATALGVDCLQTLAVTLLIVSAGSWLYSAGRGDPGVAWPQVAYRAAAAGIVLLATSVWMAWAIARLWAAPILFYTWRVWQFASLLLRPLSIGAMLAESLLRRLSGRNDSPTEEEAFEEEIRAIVTEGHHDGLLEADAREMIEGVIELGDADVADIMTPRSNIDAIRLDVDWTTLLGLVIQSGRTRMPVYQENLDDVVGILYVKDLLPELAKDSRGKRRPLRDILRQATFVPTTRRLDDLLQDFLQTRNHLAIVLDEYMSVAGLVTIEDVLEEIVGEIVDESDKEHVGEINRIDDSIADVVGRAHLDEVSEELGIDLPQREDVDTIGGLVVAQLGRIPLAGESIEFPSVRITVLEASGRRVERLRMHIQEHAGRETA